MEKDLCEICGTGIEEAPGGCGCMPSKSALRSEIDDMLCMYVPYAREVDDITRRRLGDAIFAYISGLLDD